MDTILPNNNAAKPRLILIRGLPGSGKSYLAAALREALGASRVVILDPDAINYDSKEYTTFSAQLTAEGVEAKFHPHRFLRTRAEDAVRAGKTIIWNQAFTNLGGFTRTIEHLQAYAAQQHTALSLLIVEVEIDHPTAKQRVAQRESQGGHGVNDEVFERFIRDYQSFAEQGHHTVSIHGTNNVQSSVQIVLQALGER